MALVSPRAQALVNPEDAALGAEIDWFDEVEHRRKLAEAIQAAAAGVADIRALLAPAVAALDLDITVGVPVTATFTTFTAWNEAFYSDVDRLEADHATGLVTCKQQMVAHFSVNVNADLANNVNLLCRVVSSAGSLVNYVGAAEGSGSGVLSQIAFSGLFLVPTFPTTISLEVARQTGSSTINFQSCNLIVNYAPYEAVTVNRQAGT